MDHPIIFDIAAMHEVRRILVIRLKALGDIVLSLPIVTALRRQFPDAWIGYLCRGRYSGALAGDTGLDDVVVLPGSVIEQVRLFRKLRRSGIDIALDLLSSPRSALITWICGARVGLGMDVGRHRWCYHHVIPRAIFRDGRPLKRYTLESNRDIVRMLNIPVDIPPSGGDDVDACSDRAPVSGSLAIGFPAAALERRWADEYVAGLGIDRSLLVGVVPGAKCRSKSWPLDRFVRLSLRLVGELGLVPVILWGPGEEQQATELHNRVPGSIKSPDIGIARLGALIKKLRLLVSADTGPKHIAVIQGVPTVTLFGPTDPRTWDPMTERHRVIDCSPFRDRECERNRGLSGISVGRVADEVTDLLRMSV